MNWKMRVFMQKDWSTDFCKVWILCDSGTRTDVMGIDGKSMYEVERGGPLGQPSFEAPSAVIEELVREGAKTMPASDATVEHLKDAIAVRDRLLTVFEKAAFPPRIIDVKGNY